MISYLAVENGDSNVTILGVNPGAIRTESVDVMLGDLAGPMLEKERRTHPMRRLAAPDEMAEAIVLLTTPAARWAHGTVVDLDGGAVFSMWGRFARECLEQVAGDGATSAETSRNPEGRAPMAEALRFAKSAWPKRSEESTE